MAIRRWLRLDAGWMDSAWIAALSPGARLSWVALLGYVKLSGSGGSAKALSAAVAARKWDIPLADIEAMLAAARADGAMDLDADGDWRVVHWSTYQEPDNTAMQRKRNQRDRESRRDNRDTLLSRRDRGVTRRATETETETETETDPMKAPSPSLTTLSSNVPPDDSHGKYDTSNPWHSEVEATTSWFYAQPGRRTRTPAALDRDRDELRKVLALDMADTPEPDRAGRLRAALSWGLEDSFWGIQLPTVSGLRHKGQNGQAKWMNLEAAMRRSRNGNPVPTAKVYPRDEEAYR